MADSIYINQAGSYNPNAKESTTNIYNTSAPTRMSSYFHQLHEEITDEIKCQTRDELLYYKTKLDGKKGVEEKLKDGGFSDSFIRKATLKKELYAKKALLFDCYPSAQEINLLLFTDIVNSFTAYVEPMIKKEAPQEDIIRTIHEKIVLPIMDKINADGAEDKDLRFTSDHIYGMIYYLTGRCHLNWKDYDHL